jgi:transcriptional regulator with XRE-family HTH domain
MRRVTPTTLARLRSRLKLTQAGLARLLGISTNTVARLERGELPISEPMARLLLFVARDVEEGRGYANYLATVGKRQTRPSRRKEKKQ